MKTVSQMAVSASLFLLVAGLSLIGHFVRHPALDWLTLGCLAAYLAREARRVPEVQRAVGVVLILAGIALAIAMASLGDVLLKAVHTIQSLLVMFAAVSFVQLPALRSESLNATRNFILAQRPAHRYLTLALVTHVLGSIINFAAFTLLGSLLVRVGDATAQRRMTLALVRGFAAASCWSPFFVSIAIIQLMFPGLRWTEIVGYGAPLALIFLLLGWLLDCLEKGGNVPAADAGTPVPWLVPKLALLALSVVTLVVGTAETMAMPVPIAMGLVLPPYAFVWLAVQSPSTVGRSVAELGTHVGEAFSGLRTEALLFSGAGVAGQAVASAIDIEGLVAYLDGHHPEPLLMVAGLVLAVTGLASCGLHPVVVVIVVGQIARPELTGLTPTITALSLLAGWSLSAAGSPTSALSIYVGRLLGLPSWVVAWRWNGRFVVLGIVVSTMLVAAIQLLLLKGWAF